MEGTHLEVVVKEERSPDIWIHDLAGCSDQPRRVSG
jgi:hypothetical protein